jgi:hypothetical protein
VRPSLIGTLPGTAVPSLPYGANRRAILLRYSVEGILCLDNVILSIKLRAQLPRGKQMVPWHVEYVGRIKERSDAAPAKITPCGNTLY